MTSPSKATFLDGRPTPLVATLPLPPVDILELYRRLDRPDRPSFFLESGNGTQTTARYSVIATAPYMILLGNGQTYQVASDGHTRSYGGSAFQALQRILAGSRVNKPPGLPPFFGGAVGFLSYDLVRTFESLPTHAMDDVRVPDVAMAFFDLVAVVDHTSRLLFLLYCPAMDRFLGEPREKLYREGCDRLSALEAVLSSRTSYVEPPAPLDKAHFHPEQTREQYVAGVRQCQEYIAAGDIYQANLSHRFRLSLDDVLSARSRDEAALALYRRLRRVNPSPFSNLARFGDVSLVSCSPERLVRLDASRASTRPIAGTRPRGHRAEEDGRLRDELLHSAKERAEHLMLVDLERNDLGKVCAYGSVRVDEFMTIERYSHVNHLVSDVHGTLRPGTDPLDLVRAVFPGGTITGVPKVRCMEIIEELEPVRRGLYTGSLGYFSWSGDLDLNILIRTLVLTQGRGYLQVGAGIVADSVPDKEYEETLSKAAAFFRILEERS
jgi:aminodeoxychorismate synthase component I